MGPTWLGIGAQRCGTTWFTELLCQQPELSAGRKERHQLYLPIQRDINRYEFEPGEGEFTPYYLSALWIPSMLSRYVEAGVPLIVLLRDPVDRFESAVRWGLRNLDDDTPIQRVRQRIRRIGSHAQWGGMYASQLEAWSQWVDRDRMVVVQYELLRDDPQAVIDDVWRRIGVDPVPLTNPEKRSETESTGEWALDSGLRSTLQGLYQPEAARLGDWGVDLRLWPHVAVAS